MKVERFEIYLLVDADGNAVVSLDQDKLAELYDDEIGGDSAMGRRVVKVMANVPLPEPIEATCTVEEVPA